MRRARALGLVSSRLAIRGKALKERECFFDGGGAVHAEPLRGEAFVQQLAQAFFVVEDENAAAFEDFDRGRGPVQGIPRSEEHTSELQSRLHLVCRLLLEKKKEYQLVTHI